MGEVDQSPDDETVRLPLDNRRHQSAIDLEHVDWEVGEVGEAGIAASEVVDGDGHSRVAEARQMLRRSFMQWTRLFSAGF